MRKILLPWIFVPCIVGAQTESTQPADTLQLNEVVVTPTGTPDNARDIPLPVHVVDRRSTQRRLSRTVPEALGVLPGVFVQKTNHGGGSPFVRGLTGNQVLFLVDGIRFNTATFRFGPNQYLNTLDPFTLRRVEVVPGSGSVQYGSDAIGGVVHLMTRDPEFLEAGRSSGEVDGRAATHGMEYTGHGQVAYGSRKVAFLAGGTLRNFGDLLGGGNTGLQRPSGYRERSAHAKLALRPTRNLTITLSHQALRQDDVPLYHRVALENFAYYRFDPQEQSVSYLRSVWQTSQPWASEVRLIASYLHSEEKRVYRKNGSDTETQEEDRVGHAGLTTDVFSKILPFWTANSGMEIYHDRVASGRQRIGLSSGTVNASRGLYPDGAQYSQASAYTLHHLGWRAFRIEAGLRYTAVDARIPADVTVPPTEEDIRMTPSAWVGNLGALYRLDERNALSLTWSSGFRAPNVDDFGTLGLVDFRWEIPAYDLRPERSNNFEFGYRHQGSRTLVQASVFANRLSDLIIREQVPGEQINDYDVYTKRNSESALILGAEAHADFRLGRGLALQGAIAYLYGQNVSSEEPMRRIPPLNGRAALSWTRAWFGAELEVCAAAKQDRLAAGDISDNRIPQGGTPGWTVINAYTSFTFGPVDLRVVLQNLGNASYRLHGSGIDGVGRSALFGATYTF